MSVRKRNEYLEGDDSDDEIENGYDSAAAAEEEEHGNGKGRGAIVKKNNKRRKFDAKSGDEDDDISDDEVEVEVEVQEEEEEEEEEEEATDSRFDLSRFGAKENGAEEENIAAKNKKNNKSKEIQGYESAHAKSQKSGVLYISRVPPFMKPQTLKHFLAPYASKGLGRIFLTPEDYAQHSKRVKNGGNKKKSFTDGWVEFNRKKEAKLAVEQLNGNIIGGKKGGFYHDDIWNMKYLRGFKWDHLTEQISNENAQRATRVREGIRRTRKENKQFIEDVERGKMLMTMERKSREKEERGGGNKKDEEKSQGAKMKFKQNKSLEKVERGGESGSGSTAFGLDKSVRRKIL